MKSLLSCVPMFDQDVASGATPYMYSPDGTFVAVLLSIPFYPRDSMLVRVIEIATCLSVCPSVTRRYCVKTKKASGMISSPSDSPKTLVF